MRYLCTSFLLAVCCLNVFAQSFDWTLSTSGSIPGVHVDVNGDILVPNSTGTNLVIRKYNAAGTQLWVKNYTGTMTANVGGDNAGNFYITGTSFIRAGMPGPDTLAAYIAKFDVNGDFVSAAGISNLGGSSVIPMDMYVDSAGTCYVAGFFNTTAMFGNVTLATTVSNGFLVKFNSAGVFQWVKHIESNYALIDQARDYLSVTGDKNGNVYLGGEYNNSSTPAIYVKIGNTTLTATSTMGIYIAKLNAQGTLQYLKGSTSGNINCHSIALDTDGNLFMTGYLNGTVQLGSLSVTFANGGEDLFIAKHNSAGTWEWVKTAGGVFGAAMGNTRHHSETGNDITTDRDGNLYITGACTEGVTFGSIAPPINHVHDVFVAKSDPAGNWLWVRTAGGNNSNTGPFGPAYDHKEEGVHIRLDADGNVYATGRSEATNPVFGGTALTTDYFFTKISQDANEIRGVIYLDANGNNVRDSAEVVLRNKFIRCSPRTEQFTTNANGAYTAYVPAGNYTAEVVNPPLYTRVVPDSIPVSFSGGGAIDSLNDFGIQRIPDVKDMRVLLNSFTPPRRGQHYPYLLTYENIGTDTMSGSVQLVYSDQLNYQSASVTPLTVNGDTLTWVYANMLPAEKRTVRIEFTVSGTAIAGTPVESITTVFPVVGDTAPQNNTKVHLLDVLGAPYDPNNKEVNTTQVDVNDVGNDFLEYTINFQNIGTAPAVNVFIHDTLDNTRFDLPTFEVLASSHPQTYTISGAGEVEWTFAGINLPDSTADEPQSHGFVMFRVKPLAAIAAGDSIVNKAHIVFDTNAPIITNEAITEVVTQISLAITTITGTSFCEGEFVSVDFTASHNLHPENQFSLELSDANGSFASPTVLSTDSFSTSGYMGGLIPNASGTGFRVRIVSSNPAIIGADNGTDIVIRPNPVVVMDVPVDNICEDASPLQVTASPPGGTLHGDGTSGLQFNPAGSGLGTKLLYYTYTDSTGCNAIAYDFITVHAVPTGVMLGGDGAAFCTNATPVVLTGSPSGGVYSGNGVADSLFTPADAGVGTHQINYLYTDSNGCGASDSIHVTVRVPPAVTLDSVEALCVSSLPTTLVGAPVGGVYSGTGVLNEAFMPAVAGAGMHTVYYAYTDSNGCVNIASIDIAVNAEPVIFFPDMDVCFETPEFALNTGFPVGGTYWGPDIANGMFSPGFAGIGQHAAQYDYTDSNGCFGSANATITVHANPIVTFDDTNFVCINVNPVLTLTGGSPEGGVYSGAGVSNGEFDASVAGLGTHALGYSYTDLHGCSGSALHDVTVDVCGGIHGAAFNHGVTIYPNPTEDKIFLSFETEPASMVSIRMFTLMGKEVYRLELQPGVIQNRIEISTSALQLPASIYYMQITSARGSESVKVAVD